MYYQIIAGDENHEFAFSEFYGGETHISHVKKSGRHDFTCLGCRKPMLAILRKIYGAKPYFRHDVQNISISQRCTFSNEEFRKKLVLDGIQLDKQVYIPPLYKYPPTGTEGLAIPIQAGQFQQFTTIKRSQHIWETADGQINIIGKDDSCPGDLLLTIDAVCYNEENEPVLFILISNGKHKKKDVEQMAALSRLKVDTIEITPVKSSAEDIYRSVMNGRNTKWLYNDDERQFDYFSLSEDIGNGVQPIDIDQGRLYEETFDCRKVQINNLIRALNKCLGSESFRRTDDNNRRIIGETEFAITGAEQRWRELEEIYRGRSEEGNRIELDTITNRRERLKSEKGNFENTYQDLERRYFKKRREIEGSTSLLQSNAVTESSTLGGRTKSIETVRSELDRNHRTARERLDDQFRRSIESIENSRREIERAIAIERTNIIRIQQDIERAPKDLIRKQNSQRKYFDGLEAREREDIFNFEKIRDGRSDTIGAARTALEAKFEDLRRQSIVTAQNEDVSGTTNLAKRIQGLIDARGFILAVEDAEAENRRLRAAQEFIATPTGQAWVESNKSR